MNIIEMMNLKNNRKGQENKVVGILLAIVILFVCVYIVYSLLIGPSRTVLVCPTSEGAKCIGSSTPCSYLDTDTKSFETSIDRCPDKNSPKCCTLKPSSTPVLGNSAECNGKNKGDYCDAAKVNVCDGAENGLSCTPLCVFCSRNPADAKCQVTVANKKIVFSDKFMCCQISADACKKMPAGTCIYDSLPKTAFCSIDVNNNFCCVPQ